MPAGHSSGRLERGALQRQRRRRRTHTTPTPLPAVAAPADAPAVAVVDYPADGLQNGAPDGLALVDDGNTVLEFLSYEG